MPTTVAAGIAEVGIALQSAEGSGATAPSYTHPIYSGLPKPNESVSEMLITDTATAPTGWYKTQQWGEFDTVFPALPKSLGAWLKAFIGQDIYNATVHTMAFPTPDAPPFATVFAKAPGAAYRKITDCTVSELDFQFAAGEILKVEAKGMGYTPSDLGGAYATPSNTGTTAAELMTTTGPYFTYVGSTCKLDLVGAAMGTTFTTIRSGTVTWNRALTQIQGTSLNPNSRNLGAVGGGVNLNVVWQDYTAFKNTYYGTTTGTTTSAAMVKGSLSLTFAVGPTPDATPSTLVLQMPSVHLRIPSPPDVDPSDGPLDMNIVGFFEKPTSGAIYTAILTNAITAAYT